MKRFAILMILLCLLPAHADRRSALINQKPAAAGGSSLSSGLVLLWELDEASGTRVATVGGLDLTDNNTVTGNTGPAGLGNASEFLTANSEYLSRADDSALQEGDFDSHWVVWIYSGSLTGQRMIVTKDDDSDRGHLLYTSNTSLLWDGPDTGGTSRSVQWSAGLSTATWYMIDWGYDKSAARWFINVNAGTRVTGAFTAPQSPQTAQFRVGAREYPAFEGYYTGRICYLMRWNRILSGSELTQLYNSGNGLPYPF